MLSDIWGELLGEAGLIRPQLYYICTTSQSKSSLARPKEKAGMTPALGLFAPALFGEMIKRQLNDDF